MGRDKALIEIGGVPMAVRVATAMRSAGCTEVVAYGGDPESLTGLGMEVWPDRYPAAGPLGGVLGALELFGERDRIATGVSPAGVFVVACDLPALTGSHLRGLVEALLAKPDADVVVARTSAIEPTCAIWNPAATERIRSWFDEGERAIHVAIGRLDHLEVDVEPAALRNINTPEELRGYP